MKDQVESLNRRNVLQAIGGLGAATLAGCVGTGSGPQTDATQTTNSDSSAEGTADETATEAATAAPMADSIEFWEMAGSYGGLMDRYAQETGTEISHTNMGYSEIINKMQTRLISGQGAPSTALIEQKKTLKIASTGGLRDLRPRMEDAGIIDEFNDGVLSAVTGDEGQIYSVPDDIAPTTLYYRRDVWDEHGLAPHDEIETWDQLIEEGKKLPDDISLLSLPASGSNLYWRFLNRMQGGQEFNENGEVVLNGEEGLKAARMMKRLSNEGLIDRGANWSQQWFSGFQNGTITGYATGSWFYGTITSSMPETEGNWRGFKLPALESGGNRASNRGGSGLVIPQQASEEEANRVWDYIKFVTATPKQNALSYKNEGQMTAHEPSWDQSAFSNAEFDFFGGQQLANIWIDTVPDIPGYRFTVDSPIVSSIINEEMRNMIDEGDSPKQALDRAAQRVADRTGRDIA
ncbi:ABC transporter substrate-binding protein [Haloferax sp. ATB1]|uniref:ABC transporter substrate-binding protein n=1 Tax=Haloferax sp. ATB1 TaxID=1508454 RepID=UPI0006935C70|nr:extracellular solute-binding protein [Haloferax sp. ATB1]